MDLDQFMDETECGETIDEMTFIYNVCEKHRVLLWDREKRTFMRKFISKQ